MPDSRTFAVVQMGARRSYSVPILLQRAGLLERFFTDICADCGLGRWLSAGHALPLVGQKLRRLAARRLPPDLVPMTYTYGAPLLRHAWAMWAARNAASRYRAAEEYAEELGHAIAREGFGQASSLYSMLGECPPALKAARSTGLVVWTEMYIALSADDIVAAEREAYPDWEPTDAEYETFRKQLRPEVALLENTDYAICPSTFVRDDLVQRFGFPADRTRIVPYGVDDSWFGIDNNPQRGRILFAGSANLRKGVHYLAMAAEMLNRAGRRYEYRVAGEVTPIVAQHPRCRSLTFLGRLPRTEIASEFQQADVFVLPTLAEGSAEVVYQALAAGVPVVTTEEAGSIVVNGKNGTIVRARSPEEIAAALDHLIQDRQLRQDYARAGRESAHAYGWDAYRSRLGSTLSSAPALDC